MINRTIGSRLLESVCLAGMAVLMLSVLMEAAPATAQEARNYRVFIEAGDFTLDRNGSSCKFIDLTRIPVGAFEVNSSFPSYETTWVPEYDVNECGFFLRPKLEMAGQWFPTPLLPAPGDAPPEDFVDVDFRLVLQIRDCSGDACQWIDTKVSLFIRTDQLIEAGTDLTGKQVSFTLDDDVHGDFVGAMHLKVGTERVSP